MNIYKRGRSLLIALAVTAIAAMALGAAGASASTEIAKWQQSTSVMRWQGALTVDAAKAPPKTCSSVTANGTAAPGGTAWSVSNSTIVLGGSTYPVLKLSCEGGTELKIFLSPPLSNGAMYDTVSKSYSLLGGGEIGYTLPSPYGQYTEQGFIVPFTNAVGGGTSTINFSNTVIGNSLFGSLTLSGNITIDDGKGNPRTLTH